MRKFLVFILLSLLLSFGCAQKKAVSTQDALQSQVTQSVEKKSETSVKPSTGQDQPKVESQETGVKTKSLNSDVGGISGGLKDIHFDFDSYAIRNDAEPVLKGISDYIVKNGGGLLVEGHCDERGTNEYNLALGERRARAAKNYLVSLGVSKSKLEMVSLGEEKPVCNESGEECWQKNRRAHFIPR